MAMTTVPDASRRTARVAVAAVLWLLHPSLSHAGADGGHGWYVGAGTGSAQVEGRCDGVDAVTGVAGCEHDTVTLAGRIFVGYQFTEWFAVEAGYADLGTFRERHRGETVGDDPAPALLPAGIAYSSREEVKIIGTVLNFVFRLPLAERWDLVGNVGYFEWDQDFSAVVTTPLGTFERRLDQSGPDTTAGLSLAFRPGRHWSVRAGWNYFAVDGDHHDVYALDLIWRF